MIARKDLGRKVREVLGPLTGAALIAYFGYHAVQGDRGLLAWWSLRQQIEEADYELAAVTAQKKLLEHRVRLLRPESLDRDMLEERARAMLGVVHKDDLIVPDPTDAPRP
ncbi:MAG: septum formation initiator family protein [Rhodospirillaceae bacterium]